MGSANTGSQDTINLKAFLLLSGAHLLTDAYQIALSPLLPLLVNKLSLSLTLAGMLASIFSFSSSLLQPFYGMLSDRFNSRFFIILGPLATGIGMSCLGIAPSFTVVAILLLLSGIGPAAFHPQAAATAGRLSGSRKGLGISLFIAGGSTGFALGPLAMIGIISWVGLEHSYIAALPAVLYAMILMQYFPHIEVSPQSGRRGLQLGEMLRRHGWPLGLLFGTVVIRECLRLGMVTFLPVYLTSKAYALLFGGAAVSLLSFSSALGGIIGGYLSDRFGRKQVLIVSNLFVFPLMYAALQSEGMLFLVLLFSGGLCLFAANAVTIALAQELVPERAGTVSSVVMGFGWGVGGLTMTLFGGLADYIGMQNALNYLVLLPFLSVILALGLPSLKPQIAQEKPDNGSKF